MAPTAIRPTPLNRLGAARRSTFSHKETFAQKPIGDSVMMVEAGRFGMADRVLGQLSLADGLAASDET
ncbi:hypothetical protein NKI04_27930, partial [Mesorhizobium sp. M0814]|uniref:hypothetical protein n=1 Tax=Mesorhizobium sp. M0814 TaxID=2957004 RepID=UPI00333A20BC